MNILTRIFGRKKSSVAFATRTVESSRQDGSWTAELSKDGILYARIGVGSISALIAQSK